MVTMDTKSPTYASLSAPKSLTARSMRKPISVRSHPYPSILESYTLPPYISDQLQDPVVVGVVSAVGASALTLGYVLAYRRYWRRIRNADYVTSEMILKKKWVRGVCTSVGDGDNLRFFHTPGPFYNFPFKIRFVPKTTKELRNETLSIRIAGVDAPENAHFGNEAQPHAKESLEWLRSTILGKRMRCQILAKDQYNRIVAVPYISRRLWFDKPLPLLMLRKGMAVVYTAGGAEYGPWGLDRMMKLEAEARNAKRGLWAGKNYESPGDFKARMKMGEPAVLPAPKRKNNKSSGGLWGILKRLVWR